MADQTATLQFQFAMLQGVIGESWSIKSIKAGHEPMISRPGELARVLVAETY